MHLFRSDWLREPPRPVVASYARRAYGRRDRRSEADGGGATPVAAWLASAPLAFEAPPQPPRLDRAA